MAAEGLAAFLSTVRVLICIMDEVVPVKFRAAGRLICEFSSPTSPITVPVIESYCCCAYADFRACYWFLDVLVLIADSILTCEVSLGAVTNEGARLLTFLASSSTLAICCKLVVTDFLF